MTRLLLLSMLAVSAYGQISIDSGGPGDNSFTGGNVGSVAVMPVTVIPPGTNDNTFRYGTQFSYDIQLPSPGVYVVWLYFIEPWYSGKGQRVFSVTANDQPILSNLDLAGEGLYMIPTGRAFVMAVAGTDLLLNFMASKKTATVSAILVSAPMPVIGDR